MHHTLHFKIGTTCISIFEEIAEKKVKISMTIEDSNTITTITPDHHGG